MVAARVGGIGTNEDRLRVCERAVVIGKKLLIRRLFKIGRKGIEPVGWTVDLVERLNALTATRNVILVVVRILPIGQSPLAEVVGALRKARPGFCLR